MAEHPNVAKIREGYDAFEKGDLEAVGKLWADDIVFHSLGQNSLSGDFKGQEAIFGFFGKLFENTGGTVSIEVHDVFANDEHGVALVKFSASKDGQDYLMNEVHVMHLENGLVTEYWAFEEDQRRADEFFG